MKDETALITTPSQKTMGSRAERRLRTVTNHLLNATAASDQPPSLCPQPAASEFFSGSQVFFSFFGQKQIWSSRIPFKLVIFSILVLLSVDSFGFHD